MPWILRSYSDWAHSNINIIGSIINCTSDRSNLEMSDLDNYDFAINNFEQDLSDFILSRIKFERIVLQKFLLL